MRENFYALRSAATGPGLMPAHGKLEWIKP